MGGSNSQSIENLRKQAEEATRQAQEAMVRYVEAKAKAAIEAAETERKRELAALAEKFGNAPRAEAPAPKVPLAVPRGNRRRTKGRNAAKAAKAAAKRPRVPNPSGPSRAEVIKTVLIVVNGATGELRSSDVHERVLRHLPGAAKPLINQALYELREKQLICAEGERPHLVYKKVDGVPQMPLALTAPVRPRTVGKTKLTPLHLAMLRVLASYGAKGASALDIIAATLPLDVPRKKWAVRVRDTLRGFCGSGFARKVGIGRYVVTDLGNEKAMAPAREEAA